jgi:repressor LexA
MEQATKFNRTKKQKEAYDFIHAYIDEHGISPTYDEIQEGMGLKSKSNVVEYVVQLKKRGWIDFIPNHARSITIIKEEKNAS